MKATEIQKRLSGLADPRTASFLQRFFKTGPGEYAEGDLFRGIRVPALRRLARECQGLTLAETEALLRSRYHEDRLLALLILVRAYARGGEKERRKIYRLYLRSAAFVNNWDLVDSSAPHVVGAHLEGRDRGVLYRLARSNDLWGRRIAILATLHFIRSGEFEDTLKIAAILSRDEEDLIHKAVGWMLREVGKRDIEAEEGFLREHCRVMPRTMLRYAIEKFPEAERRRYLRGAV